jgi:DNA ligase 1
MRCRASRSMASSGWAAAASSRCPRPCAALFKLKPTLDAEARVVGHRRGSGKYGGQLGALEVETEDGKRFFLGSGLSDAERRNPPPIGAQVTYRYGDLTSCDLPRFATYVRRCEDW